MPVSGVLRRAEARLEGFPAGSPSGPKPWRFAAWRSESRSPLFPPFRRRTEARPWSRRDPCGRSRKFRLTGHGLAPLSCRVRSSRAETRSCPTMPRSRSSRLSPVAAPCPKTGLPPGRISGSSRSFNPACSLVLEPEGLRIRDGRFTKPAAFASAQGQARSFRLAAASSAALPSRRFPMPGGTRGPFRSGCGWEGDQPLPAFRLGHERKLSRISESRQADSDCGKRG